LRVDPELRQAAERVLREGETLSRLWKNRYGLAFGIEKSKKNLSLRDSRRERKRDGLVKISMLRMFLMD